MDVLGHGVGYYLEQYIAEGQPMVVYIESTGEYLEVQFTSWTQMGNGGGFSYIRSGGGDEQQADCGGCTDEAACNYDPEAQDDDGSCEYPEENYDCDGDCIAFDDCGVCGGDNGGDVNADGQVDVLDVVVIIAEILDGTGEFSVACADVNGDGSVNVSDIVIIINGILGGRTVADASEVKLNISNGVVEFEADGFVGAVQMSLSHGPDFSINLTDDVMAAACSTTGNNTTCIWAAPDGDELFYSSGDFTITEAIFADEQSIKAITMPTEISIGKAYPNPFNPSTSFNVYVPAEGVVNMSVYNVMGQIVDVIHSGNMSKGSHKITWNAFDMTSGVYFVRAESIDGVSVQKVMLMK